ncbi:MAG: LptF/LptG family permease, partial [Pseudomonadota bacterium]
SLEQKILYDVMILINKNNSFYQRINASEARLVNSKWLLQDAILMSPNNPAKKFPTVELPTSIGLDHLEDVFASPETISFWKLPNFIKNLQKTGLPARNHIMHLYAMLASPFMLSAMVIIGASFSIYPARNNKTGKLVVLGIFTGFAIYYMNGLVTALGKSGNIPIIMAACFPVIISMIIGISALLHAENQ